MTPAYNILYLENARSVMATMLDFAVYEFQALYSPYHEMDIRQSVDKMNDFLSKTE